MMEWNISPPETN